MQNAVIAMENSMEAVKKIINVELPYDPVISLLGIYPKDWSEYLKKILAHPCLLQNCS